MAGPTASVIVTHVLTDDDRASVTAMIDSVSDHREAGDFSVTRTHALGGSYVGEGRPFHFEERTLQQQYGDDASASAVVRAIGSSFDVSPVSHVDFAAMWNGAEDHRILGELCLWAAERLRGLVDFGGALLPRLSADAFTRYVDGTLTWDDARPFHRSLVAQIPGKIIDVPYATASGRSWAFHVGDPAFLRAWLAHPGFHMIK